MNSPHFNSLFLAALAAICSTALPGFSQCQPRVVPGPFTSMDGEVTALAQFEDGRGGQAVYVGGTFRTVNGQSVPHVLRWWPETGNWEACDDTAALRNVRDLETFDDGTGPALFASTEQGVFRLNYANPPFQWSRVGSPTDPISFASYGDLLATRVFGDIYLFAVRTDLTAGVVVLINSSWVYLGGAHSVGTGPLYTLAPHPTGAGLVLVGTPGWGAAVWNGISWASASDTASPGQVPLFGAGTVVIPAVTYDDGVATRIFVGGPQTGGDSGVFALTGQHWGRVGDRSMPPIPSGYTFALAPFDSGHGIRLVAFSGGSALEWDGARWSTLLTGIVGVPPKRAIVFQRTRNSPPILIFAGRFGLRDIAAINLAYLTSCLPCPADFDHSGNVGIQDLLSYLQAWFARDPSAEFDETPGIDVNDLFAFLSAWHAGCL